jgi:hypothetical protein
MDNKDLSRALTSDTFSSLVLGNKIFVGATLARGKPFIFTPDQAAFLIALQKLKSIHAAALSLGKDEAWADKFLLSRKFVLFRNLKLEEAKVKAGINTEMLMQYAQWNLEGKKVWWDADCQKCGYKDEWTEYQVESTRQDDLTLKPECPICFEEVKLNKQEKPFSLNREQMDHWKELAARFWPKVERISHQFSSESIVFETEEAS